MSQNGTDQAGFNVIGTRPVRHDGFDKVTGRAKYGADFAFPGMLHGRVLRSPYVHARIRSINVERALALPGVKAVITGADLPTLDPKLKLPGETLPYNVRDLSHNVLARDKVLYDGHAVAAVAATTRDIADEALSLIEVDYEVLPPVLDVREAMAPDAPILHPNLRTAEEPDKPTNIANHTLLTRGELQTGFDAADFIVEREFQTRTVHQGYIEPHNALAVYHHDGTATVYSSSQAPFALRAMTSAISGVFVHKVVPAEIGGGFGAKIAPLLEPLAVVLAQKTAQPVKMVLTRAEEFRAAGPTSGVWMKVRMGATKSGKITAADFWIALEAGAFPGSPMFGAVTTSLASYAIDNFRIEGFDVVVNRPKVAAYRAPGAAVAAFGVETVIDELAEACGVDPIDFRISNGVREGSPNINGIPYKRIGFIQVCEAIKNSSHYRSELKGNYRGRGVAFGFWHNAGGQSSAQVNIHNNGSVSVVTGAVDIGGTRAVSAMIVAEVLGLKPHEVRPVVVDTDSTGHTDPTGGSRTAFATGWAAHEAAHDALRQLKERAAKIWNVSPQEVDFIEGRMVKKGNGSPPLSIKEITASLYRTGGPISGRCGINAGGVGPTFGGCLVDLEIDPETGKIQILRCTATLDAGRAIHPSYVEGQAQGGTCQGLGWALNEEYVYDQEGRLRNQGWLDYRMPTCLDVPMIETPIVEVPNPGHPLGIRGVGEISIVPPIAAVANAVYNATGIRITELPISPPRMLKALERRAGESTGIYRAAVSD